ncbi:MAG: hypothetical protein Rubg2KO_37260 [Rubricoccaceae bacterium]
MLVVSALELATQVAGGFVTRAYRKARDLGVASDFLRLRERARASAIDRAHSVAPNSSPCWLTPTFGSSPAGRGDLTYMDRVISLRLSTETEPQSKVLELAFEDPQDSPVRGYEPDLPTWLCLVPRS